MSNKPYKGFEPKWLLTPAPAGSYRSIFRWGDPEFFKYPKESLYKMMKEAFHMTDEDFRDYMYQYLAVNTFAGYISGYLANVAVNCLSCLALIH